ncbi:hypothetical protein CASFOL_034003 [Castilleja foliolosa]|uniref:DUF4283 domain-containing protein n=1 Tax=Castilleja foliolosa TaxID=1961234 RepID=A0ABD3C168_9LAMI
MDIDQNIISLSAINIDTPPLQCSLPDRNINGKEVTLIARIMAPKPINMKALRTTITKAWNPTKKLTTYLLVDNTMAFVFEEEKDMEKVCNVSWTFRDYQLVIARWPPDKALTEIDLNKTIFWVHAFGIPVAFINQNNAKAIGDTIGTFIKSDLQNATQKWKRSLRLQVEIDVSKPLTSSINLSINGRSDILIEIRYERITDYYFKCGCLGHKRPTCKEEIEEKDLKLAAEKFGPWLKFENTHIANPQFRSESPNSGKSMKRINLATESPKSPAGEGSNSKSAGVKSTPGQKKFRSGAGGGGGKWTNQISAKSGSDKEEAIFSLPACNLVENTDKAWAVIGDFNAILDQKEKKGGLPFSSSSRYSLSNELNDLGLIDLGFSGFPFTWSNKRSGVHNIQQRLDRAVGNNEWLDLFPRCSINHLLPLASDHAPILLNTIPEDRKFIPFRFEEIDCDANSSVMVNTVSRKAKAHWLSILKQSFDSSTIIKTWKPPPSDWIKINVDAAFSDGKACTGLVVRDCNGSIMLASSGLHLCQDAATAESLTIMDACLLASKLSSFNVIVGSDCLSVITFINGNSCNCYWKTLPITEKIHNSGSCGPNGNLDSLLGAQMVPLMLWLIGQSIVIL